MKKFIPVLLACLLFIPTLPAQALFGGGGFSGPMPVYNVDKTVDIATITTQINTLKQLEATLKNLDTMDPATAEATIASVQASLEQMTEMQNNMDGLIMDYANFQAAWDSQYHDFSDYGGMSGEEYAQNAQNLLSSLNQSVYNAMQAQGLVAQNYDTASALQTLMQASQSAEGALSAAQVANQIAALQVQQLMQFQQIVAQSNRAQSEWLAMQTHKEENGQRIRC